MLRGSCWGTINLAVQRAAPANSVVPAEAFELPARFSNRNGDRRPLGKGSQASARKGRTRRKELLYGDSNFTDLDISYPLY